MLNNGYHLLVEAKDQQLIDFWPSTGLWKVRATKISKRGIKSLLDYLEQK